MPEIVAETTYERDVEKTNLENAVGYIESQYGYIENMFYDSEVFTSDSYSQFVKALVIGSAQYQLNYGGEYDFLTSSLTGNEKTLLEDYLSLRTDMLVNPWDYVGASSDEEIKVSQIPTNSKDFVMVTVHGIGAVNTGWSGEFLNKLQAKCNAEGFSVKGIETVWNVSGSSDGVAGMGLIGYTFNGTTKRLVIDTVKNQIITAWQQAQSEGKPLDLTAHSLGTVITYEALKELSVEHPEIQVRNLNLMGSPLGYFIDNGLASQPGNYNFSNVGNTVNIYNPIDVMTIVRCSAFEVGLATGNTTLMNAIGLGLVSKKLDAYFSNVKDEMLVVPHTAMWDNGEIIEIINKEENK